MLHTSLSKDVIMQYVSRSRMATTVPYSWVKVVKKYHHNNDTNFMRRWKIQSFLNEIIESKFIFSFDFEDDHGIINVFIEDENDAITLLLMDDFI